MTNGMRIENAEQRIVRLETQVALWQTEYERVAAARENLRSRISELQQENRQLGERQAAAEQRVGQLAQLLAATLQLHAARHPADVLTVVKEIVANIVGSEEMGIFARRPDGSFKLLDGIGIAGGPESTHHAALEEALRDGAPRSEGDGLVACVPIRMGDRVMGVIVVFRLLPQKPALEPNDFELFEVLATHAGLALHHAELRAGVAE